MIRVFVVDDHPIVRGGVTGLLETEPDFEVVGEASSGEEALALVAKLRPDVVLMDLRMPGMGGVEATRRIVEGHAGAGRVGPAGAEGPLAPPRVLVFTTYEDDDEILAAVEAGADGYLLKAAPAEELAAGVRAVVAGETVLAPATATRLARALKRQIADPVPAASPLLTPRETEILHLVAAGLSNRLIASRLHIGESTVKTHLLHVFEKLEVSDRTRAVTRAMELGLL